MTYDQKLEHVLRRASAVFAKKGYHRASIRNIARATGMSLAGLYYHFTWQGLGRWVRSAYHLRVPENEWGSQ